MIRHWSFVICYWSLIIGHCSLVFAQDASFTASVDKNRVAMGEQFEITFELTGMGSGKNFRPPSFNDFLVLSGPNQSTSMQIINGAVSSSISYSYILQPRSEGTFTVGPATIEYGGKQLHTQPVTIEVTKGVPRPKQQARQSEDANLMKQIGDNLFMRIMVDKTRIYQGEQLTATYKIYARVNVVNYKMSKLPALTGFWSEDLEVPKQIQLTNEIVNGKQYRVGVLRKVALFPQRSGTLQLDPMEVTCVVQMRLRRRGNDWFDQFFNDPFFGNVKNVEYKVQSDPVTISVVPLPTNNIPQSFSGVVGKFSLEAWLDKRQTTVNEPVTLKVKISGRGNLKLLEAPQIIIPADIERYDPKISDNISNQGGRIAGSRTFEYLLIPRHAGEQRIPSFPFSFFEIEKKEYATLTSPEFLLTVEKASGTVSTPIVGISKEDVKLLGEDIRFIKSGSISLRRKGESFVGSAIFYACSISPLLAFAGFVFYVKKHEKVLGDVAALRIRKARKIAQKRLVQAKRYLQSMKKEEFYAEVSRALWGYIGDKLSLSPADLSLELVRQRLESRGVANEAITKLGSTIEQCEYARFAPSADSLEMDQVFSEAIELIATIEEQLR
ncbi:MAG: protein BatD [Ignavibacteriae bacterium]|nr:protein BatD [Ignavibacteriota bacterium]